VQPDGESRPWPAPLVSVIVGGVIGWVLVFEGLGVWGLAAGVAIAAVTMTVVSRLDRSQAISVLLVYGIAFGLLMWPMLWFAVGLVRYWITGQSLGD